MGQWIGCENAALENAALENAQAGPGLRKEKGERRKENAPAALERRRG